MNRYGQIKDFILGDLTLSIFIFGVIITLVVLGFLVSSTKEKISYDKDYYDRYGSLPKN